MHIRVIIGRPNEPVKIRINEVEYYVGCYGDGDAKHLGSLSLMSKNQKCRQCTQAEREAIRSAIVQRDNPRREYLPTFKHRREVLSPWWQMLVHTLPSDTAEATCPVPLSGLVA